MSEFTNHPLFFFVVSFVLMSTAAWIGATVLRRRKPMDSDAREDFGVVQSATLTLLALVIGFSLSMAVGRYDQRKNYEEEEANAIGTEYLRANLLPDNEATAVRSLLAKYLEQRILFYQVRDSERLAEVNSATSQLEDQMWVELKNAAAAQPNPVTALAVAGMNDVINTQGYTQAAWWNRVPISAWALMVLIGALANLMVGYSARSARPRKYILIMPLVVSISVMLIADIDSPRTGIIRVVPQNLLSTAQSMPK
jgi:hypothetical protein